MAEVLVIGKKISEMGLVNEITGEEKIPTSALGDKAVTTSQLLTYVNNNGVAQWGRIGGDITNQADLQNQFSQQLATLQNHIQDQGNPHNVTKEQVGLGLADNTADMDKPVSTAVQEALSLKADQTYVDDSIANKTHNSLLGRDADGAHPASAILDAGGKDQQEVNDLGIPYWREKSLGYDLHSRTMLEDGYIVKSVTSNNTENPNTNMSGWLLEQASIIDLGGLSLADGTDISVLINNELQKSAERPIRLILPHGNFDLSTPLIAPTASKGVILDLNGSVLKPRASYSNPNKYLISLYSTTDYPAAVINGTIDGINRPQNLFEVTNINELLRDATNGVRLTGINVGLKNLSIKNLYGQTTKYFARNATTEDVFIDNCGGHWYANDDYDMFGDAFYIGTGFNSTGEIFVSFKNVRAFGKYSRQYPENHQTGSPLNRTMFSRIGLTIEKFGGSFNNTVYVNFDNCDFRNFERGIHQELKGITTYLNMTNTRFDYAVLFGAYLTDTLNSYACNCTFNNLDSDWLQSRGVVRSYSGKSVAVLENCTVSEIGTTARKNMFGMNATLSATNTTFNNVQATWSENLQLKLNNCTVNMSKHSSESFLTYSGQADLKDVAVNYVGTDVDTVKTYVSWNNLSMSNVTLENITPPKGIVNLPTGMQNNTLIVPDGNTQNWKGWKFNVRTKSGNLLHRSSVYWGIPEDTVNKQNYLAFSLPKPSTGNLNILTQELKDYISKRGLGVVVAIGWDFPTLTPLEAISGDASVFKRGFSVAVVAADPSNVNKVRIVQPFTHIGNTQAHNLTFDTDFNVTGYGSYTSQVLICAIPYSDLDTLPALPNRILNSISLNKGVAVTNATGTDNTAVTLNSLLTSLRNAGVIQ